MYKVCHGIYCRMQCGLLPRSTGRDSRKNPRPQRMYFFARELGRIFQYLYGTFAISSLCIETLAMALKQGFAKQPRQIPIRIHAIFNGRLGQTEYGGTAGALQ